GGGAGLRPARAHADVVHVLRSAQRRQRRVKVVESGLGSYGVRRTCPQADGHWTARHGPARTVAENEYVVARTYGVQMSDRENVIAGACGSKVADVRPRGDNAAFTALDDDGRFVRLFQRHVPGAKYLIRGAIRRGGGAEIAAVGAEEAIPS